MIYNRVSGEEMAKYKNDTDIQKKVEVSRTKRPRPVNHQL